MSKLKQTTLAYSFARACEESMKRLCDDEEKLIELALTTPDENLSFYSDIYDITSIFHKNPISLLDPEFIDITYSIDSGHIENARRIKNRLISKSLKELTDKSITESNRLKKHIKVWLAKHKNFFLSDIEKNIKEAIELLKQYNNFENEAKLISEEIKYANTKDQIIANRVTDLTNRLLEAVSEYVSPRDRKKIKRSRRPKYWSSIANIQELQRVGIVQKITPGLEECRNQVRRIIKGVNGIKRDLEGYIKFCENIKNISEKSFRTCEHYLDTGNKFLLYQEILEIDERINKIINLTIHDVPWTLEISFNKEVVDKPFTPFVRTMSRPVRERGLETVINAERSLIRDPVVWMRNYIREEVGDVDFIRDLRELNAKLCQKLQEQGKEAHEDFVPITPVEKKVEEFKEVETHTFPISTFFRYSNPYEKQRTLELQKDGLKKRIDILGKEINGLISGDVNHLQKIVKKYTRGKNPIYQTLKPCLNVNLDKTIYDLITNFEKVRPGKIDEEETRKKLKQIWKLLNLRDELIARYREAEREIESNFEIISHAKLPLKSRSEWIDESIRSTIQSYIDSGDIFRIEDVVDETGFSKTAVRLNLRLFQEEEKLFKKKGLYSSDRDVLNRLAPSIKESRIKRARRVRKGYIRLGKIHEYPLDANVTISSVKPRRKRVLTPVVTPLVQPEPISPEERKLLHVLRTIRRGRVKNAFECDKIFRIAGGVEEYLKTYGKYLSPLHHNMNKILTRNNIKDGESVLDLGCGPNSPVLISTIFNGININYTGLDVCQGIIEDNKSKYPDAEFRRCRIPYDLGNLEFDESFDCITASYFFQCLNFHEKIATLLYINNLLKKGGKIIAIVPRGGTDARQVYLTLKGLGYKMESPDIKSCYRRFDVTDSKEEKTKHYCYVITAEKKADFDTRPLYDWYNAVSLLKAGRVGKAESIAKKFNLTIHDVANSVLQIDNARKEKTYPFYVVDFNRLDRVEESLDSLEKQLLSVEEGVKELERDIELDELPEIIEKKLSSKRYQRRFGRKIGKTMNRFLVETYAIKNAEKSMPWREFLEQFVEAYDEDRTGFYLRYIPSGTSLKPEEYANIPGKSNTSKYKKFKELVDVFLIPSIKAMLKPSDKYRSE